MIAGLRRAALLALALSTAGCAWWQDGLGYYWQSVRGHLDVMQRAVPIAQLLEDPATDATLRERLHRVRDIRAFASRALALPDNGSYTAYADLGRPFVVWNVFAAPELSLRLQQWCFPVAGCVAYRGYYAREDAERFAQALRAQGMDTYVAGVPAYSTLGWFDDPVLSSFLHFPEGELARLVFHELAHQVLYLKGDTTFNESFATAVEEAGLARWLAHRGDVRMAAAWREFAGRRAGFVALLARHREQLEAVYAQATDDETRRAGKARVFASLQAEYRQLREHWGGWGGYDRWFAQPLGNAHLASVASYTAQVPAFRALLAQSDGDLGRFFEAARALADAPADERARRVDALQQAGATLESPLESRAPSSR